MAPSREDNEKITPVLIEPIFRREEILTKWK
jgi:hypothetical protein